MIGLTVCNNGESLLRRWIHSCVECHRRAEWACPQLADDQRPAPYLCIRCARRLYADSVAYWQDEVRS